MYLSHRNFCYVTVLQKYNISKKRHLGRISHKRILLWPKKQVVHFSLLHKGTSYSNLTAITKCSYSKTSPFTFRNEPFLPIVLLTENGWTKPARQLQPWASSWHQCTFTKTAYRFRILDVHSSYSHKPVLRKHFGFLNMKCDFCLLQLLYYRRWDLFNIPQLTVSKQFQRGKWLPS